MMEDRDVSIQVQSAVNACTQGLEGRPSLRSRILQQAKGEPPVKRKFTAAMALAIALILVSTTALAASILKPGLLSWLFRGEEAPQETVQLVQQNKNTRQTAYAALTLNETLFDGETLSVGFTLQNPTDEPLIYTVHHAKLNGAPLIFGSAQPPYSNAAGQALGGAVDGMPLPLEDTFFVSFIATADPTDSLQDALWGEDIAHSAQKYPLEAIGDATLSVRVDVFRPLTEYTPVSLPEYISGQYDIVTDKLPVFAEEGLLNMNALPHPAKHKKVESLEFSFPITLQEPRITTASAAPGEYRHDLYTLTLEQFSLKATGGKLAGSIANPSDAPFLSEQSFLAIFPEEVFEQALAAKDHSLGLRLASFSSGMSTAPDHKPAEFHFDAAFRSHAGPLPKGVYLVWLDDTQTYWDTALYLPLNPLP